MKVYFSHCVARNDHGKCFFTSYCKKQWWWLQEHISSYCEDASDQPPLQCMAVDCKRDDNECIFHVYCDEWAMTTSFFLHPITRVQARTKYSCEGMAMIAHHAVIKLLYAVDCNDHRNELVSQEAMTRIFFFVVVLHCTDDSEEETQDCASQQSTCFKWLLEQPRQLRRRQSNHDKEYSRPPLQRMRWSKVCHIPGSDNDEQWLIAMKVRVQSNNQLNV